MRIPVTPIAAILLLSVLCSTTSRGGQSNDKKVGVFEESESETLWTGKYAHCDYGFYVVLPRGFVAHSELLPNPNHGFLVGLPDPATVQPVSVEDPRFIYVTAEYRSSESRSLGGVVDYLIDLSGRRKNGFKVVARTPIKFGGLRATQLKVEYDTPQGRTIEEQIVVLRAGIIYEIGLRTTMASYTADEKTFEQIKAGFRFWRIHYC